MEIVLRQNKKELIFECVDESFEAEITPDYFKLEGKMTGHSLKEVK